MTSYFLCRECNSLVLTANKEKHYTHCSGIEVMVSVDRKSAEFKRPKDLVLRNQDFLLATRLYRKN